MKNRKPDFSGWATKYGIQCTDGRTILPGAFDEMEGKKVPIVWGHIHDDPDMVLGHAFLFKRPEGIWTEGYLNNGPKAQSTREALRNEDIDGLSIYANELKHVNGRQVQHGNIRELSVVLAGANKGATIESVQLAHGDEFYEELDDECIVYNDDEPMFHDEDAARAQKRKKHPADEDEEEDEDSDADEEEDEEEEEDEDDEEEDEEERLRHSDEENELQEVWDSMNEDQQNLCSYLVDRAAEGEEAMAHADDDGELDSRREVWESMNEDQQNLCAYLVGQAAEGDDDEDVEEEENEEESEEENEEGTDMKHNAFEREKTSENYLSHEDQKAIIERGRALGSMRQAWNEALKTNEVLSHDVFNDDGTKQTYGVANIDYLFPDYAELNDKPEFIQRDQDWVQVVLNGVTKTPKARLRTTFANITMEEARAKGYAKGDKKDPEVFNLLRRTVDPQTVYKYQELDQDDVIDIDDFDVIAWIKAEMRVMLNEEIARAILVGDGRDVIEKYKIKEDHIKPIVNDADLFTVKIPVTPGVDDAATAKNGIRAFIKGRKHYKGSGNLVFFTSEDALAEWLLLEDNFGHELYADATALAKKLRVNRIVTCPFLEDLTIDSQKILGLAVDLSDYVTGTNRRGQIRFFDDFDIEFNKNQFLLETRLSGMLRKPFSAMVLMVSTQSKGGPHYDETEPVGSENPKALGWYEKEGAIYRRSTDTAVDSHKTYYVRSTTIAQGGSNP